ncbi:hypothetical protein BDW68DRAFT_180939 [Aspergillus falconensis]
MSNEDQPSICETTVHAAIEQHFIERPGSVAVTAWDGKWSYAELDQWSLTLARLLVPLGVGPGVIVPVYLEKSKWTPVAIMGIMRAGGAFVLMDASSPILRVKDMCAQLGAGVVLSSISMSAHASELGPRVVYLDECLAHDARPVEGQILSRAQASDIIFVVFTSGSTGTPKGVVVEHAAMATSLAAYCHQVGINTSTRMLQFASYSFDVSVNDHLAALFAGGCICIPSESQRLNGIQPAIKTMGANTMDITPSMARILRPEQVPSIHTVILGGEAVTADNLVTWGCIKLVQVYGPAECCVTSTIRLGLEPGGDPSNIGWASGGTCWVVEEDNHNKLAPVGTIGELLIGGPILARGYLNNDGLTQAAFITDPEWAAQFPSLATSARFYKTGDLVRQQLDGSLQYVGRKDMQVKVRGQRVELGEIEYQLKQSLQRDVQVVVEQIVMRDSVSRRELVAFIELADLGYEEEPGLPFMMPTNAFRQETTDAQLRLCERLPQAMIPRVFIPVREIRLTASGKVDRKSLRDQAASLSKRDIELYMVAAQEKRKPSTASEQLLRGLCASALNVPEDELGMEDTFFQHGGDSVSAIRLVGLANERGFKLQVADIFHDPGLSRIAQALQAIVGDAGRASTPPFALLRSPAEADLLRLETHAQCGISGERIEDIYPATGLQEGMLSLSVKQKGAYVTHIPLRLEDPVHLEQFQTAWEQTLESHSILRTRLIQSERGELYQVVLRTMPEWRYGTSLMDYLAQQKEADFGPGRSLCYYAIVTDSGPEARYFVLTLHHAIYDGWSLPILLGDLDAAYHGAPLGRRDFAGFIQHLAQRDRAVSRAFWQNEFKNLDCTHFPSPPWEGHIVSPTESFECEVNRVPSRGSCRDFTMSTVIRLAWAIVLATYTDSTDVVFGVVVTGRSLPVPGIADMTGPTIATVPVRVQLNPEERCSAALRLIQTKAMQMIPFEQDSLVQIGKMGSDAALACQFQSLLVVQGEGQELPQSRIFTPVPCLGDSDWVESTYAINVVCEPTSSRIRFKATYDPKLIDTQITEMVILQLAHVTERILDDQNGHDSLLLRDLKEVGQKGLRRLLHWNGHVPQSVNVCVHEMILSHCRQTPDALAIHAWDGSLTYRELDRLSLSLAYCLHARGVHEEVCVPILMGKSFWTPVAILGIIRAGGTFVLLEPSLPLSRLQHMCSSIDASLAVTSSQCADLAKRLLPEVVIPPEDASGTFIDNQVQLPATYPQQALYVIFTSGSTGLPKPVVIEHFSFCTSASAFSAISLMDRTTRAFQFASHAFDVSVSDHLVPLMNGACLCIPSPSQMRNDLAGAITEFRATWADLTPSVARILDPAQVATLRTLNLGGEGMIKADIDKWHDKLHLVNVYGPAECSCTTVVRAPMRHCSSPHDIGHPTGGTCWVVDPGDRNRLLPIGAIGELIIQGPIVGRGYLTGDAEASSSFFEHPRWQGALPLVNSVHMQRFYATGDLVQYAGDGSLRYVGRKDKQVKLRGQRIELGEIEHHVRRLLSASRQCAVELVRLKDGLAGAILVAFIEMSSQPGHNEGSVLQLQQDTSLEEQVKDLRANLREALPSYMLPTAFVPLSHIPLSPSAKVDRKKLREFAAGLSFQDVRITYEWSTEDGITRPPRAGVETVLSEAFSKALRQPLETISVDASFFDLGGDSLTVMQLVTQCRTRGLAISTQDVFLHRTIAQLAKHVAHAGALTTRNGRPSDQTSAAGIEKVQTGEWYPLSPIQAMFFDRQPEAFSHFNQTLLVRLVEPTSAESLFQAVEAVVYRHTMLRARFQQRDGKWEQIISPDARAAYQFYCCKLETMEAMQLQIEHCQRALDIVHGPLFAVNQIQLGADCFLFLVAHHLVIDPASWRIIISDMETVLRNNGPLPPCPLDFPVWNRMQAEFAQKNLTPSSTLPSPGYLQWLQPSHSEFWGMTDRPSTWSEIQVLSFKLDSRTTEKLLRPASTVVEIKPIELFHAAILLSFTRVFRDRPTPVVWNAGHGREPWDPSLDLSQTVGWFTTLWPVVVAVDSPQQTLLETIQRTKTARRAVPMNGWAYFTARHFHPDGHILQPKEPIEVVLNFQGVSQQLERGDALFQHVRDMAVDYSRSDLHPAARQFELFEIVITGSHGELEFKLEYNSRVRHLDRVREWFFSCRDLLMQAAEQLSQLCLQH